MTRKKSQRGGTPKSNSNKATPPSEHKSEHHQPQISAHVGTTTTNTELLKNAIEVSLIGKINGNNNTPKSDIAVCYMGLYNLIDEKNKPLFEPVNVEEVKKNPKKSPTIKTIMTNIKKILELDSIKTQIRDMCKSIKMKQIQKILGINVVIFKEGCNILNDIYNNDDDRSIYDIYFKNVTKNDYDKMLLEKDYDKKQQLCNTMFNDIYTKYFKNCNKQDEYKNFMFYINFTYLLLHAKYSKDAGLPMTSFLSDDTLPNDALKYEIFESVQNKENPILDPRQNLAVQRFTKFRDCEDKVCFLLHGVGTGKTMTSLTIAFSHLSEKNIKKYDGTHTPLKIFVCCPKGLFKAAFRGDCEKLGVYVYSNSSETKNENTYEEFTGLIKANDNDDKEYEILFTGYDYDQLYSDTGFKNLCLLRDDKKFDVLICDEAHRLLTNKLAPEPDINPSSHDKSVFNEFHWDENKDTQTGQQNPRNTFHDKRFVYFISEFKQSIFLTGTIFQSSQDNIIDVVWFLNNKLLNGTNKDKFTQLVTLYGGGRGIFKTFDWVKKYGRAASSGNSITIFFRERLYSCLFWLSGKVGSKGITSGGGNSKIISKEFMNNELINNFITKPDEESLGIIFESDIIQNILKKIDPTYSTVLEYGTEIEIYNLLFYFYLIKKYDFYNIKIKDFPENPESDVVASIHSQKQVQTGGNLPIIRLIKFVEFILGDVIKKILKIIIGENSDKTFLDILSGMVNPIEWSSFVIKVIIYFVSFVPYIVYKIFEAFYYTGKGLKYIMIAIFNLLFGQIVNILDIMFEINIVNIIQSIQPYVSIYNYDFTKYAIEKEGFYSEDMNTSNINANGNKLAFPESFITHILIQVNNDICKNLSILLNTDKSLFVEKNNILCEVKPTNINDLNDKYTNDKILHDLLQSKKKILITEKIYFADAQKLPNSERIVNINIENNLKKNIKNHKQIQTNINYFKENIGDVITNIESKNTTTQSRFEHVLKMLQLIKCGAIKTDKDTYGLHPHYKKVNNNYEYFLPLVYPSTEEIMYSFVEFLNNKGHTYIWMCNKYDANTIQTNFEYGSILTFPIGAQLDKIHPICIIISPDHTEGFSFTYNPLLIAPALCNTFGDAEQVYGRILRKYGKPAINNRYQKQIYQYYGGNENEERKLNNMKKIYGYNKNNQFVGKFFTTFLSSNTNVNQGLTKEIEKNIRTPIYNIINNYKSILYNTLFAEIYEKNPYFSEQWIKADNPYISDLNNTNTYDIKNVQENIQIQLNKLMKSNDKIYLFTEEFHLGVLSYISDLSKTLHEGIIFDENNSLKETNNNDYIKPFDASFKNSDFAKYENNNSILCLKYCPGQAGGRKNKSRKFMQKRNRTRKHKK